MTQADYRRRIRCWLAIVIAGLILSGVTAFPLQSEIGWMIAILQKSGLRPVAESSHLLAWLERVNEGLRTTNERCNRPAAIPAEFRGSRFGAIPLVLCTRLISAAERNEA